MISNKDKSTVVAVIRSIDPRNPGDKRTLLDAVASELGLRQQQGLAQTDYIIPCRDACTRLNMKPRTLTLAIKTGQIKAVRKCATGKRPRSVGIPASEINAYIQRMMSSGQPVQEEKVS